MKKYTQRELLEDGFLSGIRAAAGVAKSVSEFIAPDSRGLFDTVKSGFDQVTNMVKAFGSDTKRVAREFLNQFEKKGQMINIKHKASKKGEKDMLGTGQRSFELYRPSVEGTGPQSFKPYKPSKHPFHYEIFEAEVNTDVSELASTSRSSSLSGSTSSNSALSGANSTVTENTTGTANTTGTNKSTFKLQTFGVKLVKVKDGANQWAAIGLVDKDGKEFVKQQKPDKQQQSDKANFYNALRQWKIDNIGPNAASVGINYQQAKAFLQSLGVQDPDRVLSSAGATSSTGTRAISNQILSVIDATLKSRGITEKTQLTTLNQLSLLTSYKNQIDTIKI